MVISRISGGLGNQMFQYAAGKALAIRLGAGFYLDASWYDKLDPRKAPRRFELGNFGIREPRADEADIRRCMGMGPLARCARKVFGRDMRARYRRIGGPEEYFDLARMRRYRGVYLEGYWQSESYFRDCADEIRNVFSVERMPDRGGERAELLREIERSEATAVHVRRGDYASDPRIAQRFGTCSPAYYERAVDEVRGRRPSARCFVFSEDIDWVKGNVRLPADTVFVAPSPGLDVLCDFVLMARCRHFVISNSTYGWWAAWLGGDPDKIVVAPRPWFRDLSREAEDLVPPSWTRLPQ